MTDEAAKFKALTEATKLKERRTVSGRVPRGLDEAVREFLETDRARALGFDYLIHFYTTAVRELLWKYGFFRPLSREEVTHE